jgi:spore coat protein CotF
MNDKEIMSNYLSILKSNVEVYVHGTIESSNKDIKDLLKTGLDLTLDLQSSSYNIMVDKNMYNVENTKKTNIKKTYDKLSNM